MPRESRVEIPSGSGNFYRYEYSDGATRYLGPVGDAPSLSEEEFTRSMIEIGEGEDVSKIFGRMVEEIEYKHPEILGWSDRDPVDVLTNIYVIIELKDRPGRHTMDLFDLKEIEPEEDVWPKVAEYEEEVHLSSLTKKGKTAKGEAIKLSDIKSIDDRIIAIIQTRKAYYDEYERTDYYYDPSTLKKVKHSWEDIAGTKESAFQLSFQIEREERAF